MSVLKKLITGVLVAMMGAGSASQPAERPVVTIDLSAKPVSHYASAPMISVIRQHEVPERKEYPGCGIVYGLEYSDDAVIVQTPDGELWEFKGTEDWMIGDVVAMTFRDEGVQDYIWDDEIVDARYCGHIE